VLNAIEGAAANIGNHGLNDGLAFLRQAIADAAFPYL
jgi:2',3'-cyclic-nucleotide 2'-phosphodiesterase (5'-nucleotidase family)